MSELQLYLQQVLHVLKMASHVTQSIINPIIR